MEEISTLQTLGVGAGLLPGNVPTLHTAHAVLLIPVMLKPGFPVRTTEVGIVLVFLH